MARGRSLDGVPPAQSARREKGLSLTTNAAANGASQLYLVVCTLLVMPTPVRRMGVETYGLIGFFVLMTAWFQILDAGLSLTLSRESARFRAGAIDAPTLRGLMSVLEVIFVLVAGLGAAAIAASAHVIAAHWLRANHLSTTDVGRAVLLMGLTVPLQWMTGLYRGAINGFERQVWLAGFNMVMTTLRFAGAAVAITLLAPTPWNFFCFQLAVSILELAVLAVMARRVLPPVEGRLRRLPQWREIRGLLKFSGSLAFAVVVWVLVTQIDKLILSRMLSLAEYGVYALAVLAAGAILALSGPVSQAPAAQARQAGRRGGGGGGGPALSGRDPGGLPARCAVRAGPGVLFRAGRYWAWTGDARPRRGRPDPYRLCARQRDYDHRRLRLLSAVRQGSAFARHRQRRAGRPAGSRDRPGGRSFWRSGRRLCLARRQHPLSACLGSPGPPAPGRRPPRAMVGHVLPILAAAAASAWALSRLVVWPGPSEAAFLLPASARSWRWPPRAPPASPGPGFRSGSRRTPRAATCGAT